MTALTRALRPLYRNRMREFERSFHRARPEVRRSTRRYAIKGALSDLRRPAPDPIFTMDESSMTAAQLREKAKVFLHIAYGKSEFASFDHYHGEAHRLFRLASDRRAHHLSEAA